MDPVREEQMDEASILRMEFETARVELVESIYRFP